MISVIWENKNTNDQAKQSESEMELHNNNNTNPFNCLILLVFFMNLLDCVIAYQLRNETLTNLYEVC